MNPLNNKCILLGVTGSIALYRACDLVRLLRKDGANVSVCMTEAATSLISPQVFRSLSGAPVRTTLFGPDETYHHINYAQKCELMVVAPATANFLGKAAAGIADDLLTTTYLATDPSQVIIAPAMNYRMYTHPVTQENIGKLRDHGCLVMEAESGPLACGETGQGRFPDLLTIMEQIKARLTRQDLSGHRILVTAGPTRESLDPVRYLSNRSSGRMGYALAQVAWRRGAEVTLISGPTEISRPYGPDYIEISTAAEMDQQVRRHFAEHDIFISAAAISDYRPSQPRKQKIKKSEQAGMTLELKLNPDILLAVSEKKKEDQVLIGFALESENLMTEAEKKLNAKKLDLIVANSSEALSSPTSQVALMDSNGIIEALPEQSKELTAYAILDRTLAILKDKGKS